MLFIIFIYRWSLVKLHAFQWPHKLIAYQTDSSIRGDSSLGGWGGGGVNFLGGSWYPSAHYENKNKETE